MVWFKDKEIPVVTVCSTVFIVLILQSNYILNIIGFIFFIPAIYLIKQAIWHARPIKWKTSHESKPSSLSEDEKFLNKYEDKCKEGEKQFESSEYEIAIHCFKTAKSYARILKEPELIEYTKGMIQKCKEIMENST